MPLAARIMDYFYLRIRDEPGKAYELLAQLARKSNWPLTPAQHACMVQGDDRLGALAEIQKELINAGVSIYASTGLTDGCGGYAYIIYFKEGDHLAAARAVEALKCLR